MFTFTTMFGPALAHFIYSSMGSMINLSKDAGTRAEADHTPPPHAKAKYAWSSLFYILLWHGTALEFY
jgi:hypothetical protein